MNDNDNLERVPAKPFSRRAIREQLKRAREESMTDALTDLPNKRAFDKEITDEAERIIRLGGKATVLVLDADKLKTINDTKGHEAGNIYLISIANALRNGIRRNVDFVARIGGDEFALILPGTDIEGAEKMWTDSLNPAFIERGVAITGGAALLDPHNVQDSVHKADSAMYGAKREPTRNGENLLFSYIKNG